MGKLGTNIFSIKNLKQLSSQYQMYLVKGLNSTQQDYFANRQILQRKLSYQLQNPVLIIEKEGLTYLIVRCDIQHNLPDKCLVTSGKVVSFEARHEARFVDYTVRSEINDAICIRFLQFAIQGCIRSHHDLWQIQSGFPFYHKNAEIIGKNRQRYSGFAVRPIITNGGGIGICVDMTSKTISRNPLPEQLTRDQFHQYKGQRCIYHYGKDWYEIKIASLGETYSEHWLATDDFDTISLQEFITQNVSEPLPPELTQLSPDASVVVYYNNRGEERAAPTPLCYPIYGTDDNVTGREHGGTLLHAHERHRKIVDTAQRYLNQLSIGNVAIEVSDQPLAKEGTRHTIQVPDLLFGQQHILSVRGSQNAEQVRLTQLGQRRKALLEDPDAGFYSNRPLDHQYLVLPASVYRSWGKNFLSDLKNKMWKLYHWDTYEPEIVTYEDSGQRTYAKQGKQLRKFVRQKNWNPGTALVMLHHTVDKQVRDEDELGAMVMKELRQCGVQGAIIHSAIGAECYQYETLKDGKGRYKFPTDRNKRGKLSGYLQNVALNKVLLTNSRWPFILQTPLHADVTIGLDVKGHTASLIVVGKRGGRIRRSKPYKSKQKEKLLEEQAYTYFLDVLRDEIHSLQPGEEIRRIVVHRDGIAFESEIKGIRAAIRQLKSEGELSDKATITILEIAKSAIVGVRLFDITPNTGRRNWIVNPEVGEYYITNNEDAYLCSTGRAFERHGKQKGTTNPLHIRYVEGELNFQACIEDVYSLTVLAWTRPEDCSRYPITIRLNDRFLRDEATEYDHEKLDFSYEPLEGAEDE